MSGLGGTKQNSQQENEQFIKCLKNKIMIEVCPPFPIILAMEC